MFPKCETIDEKSSARAWTSVLIARPLRPKNENENGMPNMKMFFEFYAPFVK